MRSIPHSRFSFHQISSLNFTWMAFQQRLEESTISLSIYLSIYLPLSISDLSSSISITHPSFSTSFIPDNYYCFTYSLGPATNVTKPSYILQFSASGVPSHSFPLYPLSIYQSSINLSIYLSINQSINQSTDQSMEVYKWVIFLSIPLLWTCNNQLLQILFGRGVCVNEFKPFRIIIIIVVISIPTTLQIPLPS